jgi:dihydroxyacid dehydratase/phosphogluconate dehydratase
MRVALGDVLATGHTLSQPHLPSSPNRPNPAPQVEISDAEMATRRAAWKAPPFKYTRGTMYRYIKTVSSAQQGCVTDE